MFTQKQMCGMYIVCNPCYENENFNMRHKQNVNIISNKIKFIRFQER